MTDHDDRDEAASTPLRGHLDPPDPRVRSRHIAAALDAFDELASAPHTGEVVRTMRWRRSLLAVASVAAAALVVGGIALRDHDRSVTSSNVADAARDLDTTSPPRESGASAGATQDSAATKSAEAPADGPVTLGTFSDDAELRAKVDALDTAPAAAMGGAVPVTTSAPAPPSMDATATTPPAAAPAPRPAPTSTIAAFDAALPCATTPVEGAVELRRYRAVLRSLQVTVVVVRVDGNAAPVIGILEPPDCHLREL